MHRNVTKRGPHCTVINLPIDIHMYIYICIYIACCFGVVWVFFLCFVFLATGSVVAKTNLY